MAILPLQLARVSNLLRTNIAQQSITRNQQLLVGAQNELSTGKKINSPSDDAGQAAIAQQLRKTLEQRQAYAANLKQAGSQLGEVDSSLGDLTDLLNQAQTLASANVGTDVTPEQRTNAAAVVDSLSRQLLNLGNRQFDGVYLYAGDRATDPPFVEVGGGVKYVGSARALTNVFDENTTLPFMVDGEEVFGALSTRIEGTADLTPSLSSLTRLSDLRGTSGDGIRLGSIQISNGATSANVDLNGATTIGDVINRINAAGVGGITASVAPDGVSLRLAGGGTDNITVTEVGGGTTASDLGIVQTTGAGAGTPLDGASVQPKVTLLTPLSALKAGAGIDLASGLKITNGLLNATVTFTSPPLRINPTVEDLLNAINGSGTAVRAEINSAGNGINIYNPTQGTDMTIAENAGSTAGDLGVRSFAPTTPLTELNGGKGVHTVSGNDIQITDTNGTSFQVDLDNLQTVQDVIDAINTAAGAAGAGVIASFTSTGNGITLNDGAGGAGTLSVTAVNFSTAVTDLGLDVPATGGTTITGRDINAVTADGIFAHLAALRDALRSNDSQAITAAAEGLQADHDRVVRVRGETGARVQEIESRQQRLDDQNLATRSLLSSVEDTDFTEAISRFQTIQTALQASLQTSAKVLNLSLLDFLG
jgi:flagellin-like hook-associated protein FlgL